MKYLVLLGDGMADLPVPELGNKTPLEVADKKYMDSLAQRGICGMVKTIPDNMSTGSDTANLSVMGYDTKKYYTGRSPLESVSMGIEMGEDDVAVRCNLVTLSKDEPYNKKTMLDYSADEIATEDARQLIDTLNNELIKSGSRDSDMLFYTGLSYRHCAIWTRGKTGLNITPPHDILDKSIGGYIPSDEKIASLMRRSFDILSVHPVNKSRAEKGLKPANAIWMWGEGKRTILPDFNKKYGVKGAVISAVDLLKGIGRCAGLEIIDVEGATGNIHTNFKGKALAAIDAFKRGLDFIYLHIEAPDECGHRHEIHDKVKSIEIIDNQILKPLLEYLNTLEDFAVLMLPDHPTPLIYRTHTRAPVPYVMYRKSREINSGIKSYDENSCSGGRQNGDGHLLMNEFLERMC